MQQHGQQSLPSIDAQCRAAAFLLAIVDAQTRDAIGIFDDAHRGHDAFFVADDVAACGDVDEGEAGRDERDACRSDGGRPYDGLSPVRLDGQREITDDDQQQRELRAQQRETRATPKIERCGGAQRC